MSGASRLRAQWKRPADPYLTLRAELLLSAALNLADTAFRVFLVANAVWTPTCTNATRGRAVLPHVLIQHPHPARRRWPEAPTARRIAPAIAEVLATGWMTRRSYGSRPRGAGSARQAGKAAEFDLPCRHGIPLPITLPPDIQRPKGKLRVNAQRARVDAAELAPLDLRALYAIAAQFNRYADGSIVGTDVFPMPAARLASQMGCTRSTASRALGRLVKAKRLALVRKGVGQRPAEYRLATAYRQFERHSRAQQAGNCADGSLANQADRNGRWSAEASSPAAGDRVPSRGVGPR